VRGGRRGGPGALGGELAAQLGDLGLQGQDFPDRREGESLCGESRDLLDAADLGAAVPSLAAR
jgi:hypothetical protein